MKNSLTLFLCLPFFLIYGQADDHSIVSPQGGFAKGETMTISWTVGDLVTETSPTEKGMITQGFQQPMITIRELGPKEFEIINADLGDSDIELSVLPRSSDVLNATVYPNPSGSDVQLNIENSKQEYYLDLFDPEGNLLSRTRSENAKEILKLNGMPPGQYLLRISIPGSKQTRAFQIIKSF